MTRIPVYLVMIEVDVLERAWWHVVVVCQGLEVEPVDLEGVDGIAGSCQRLRAHLVHRAQTTHLDKHSKKYNIVFYLTLQL